ncbi:MAG: hypothetical protein ACLQU4_20750 [Limisphaerales bacterium]
MKTNPTAKRPALASTGKGASLLFKKNHSRAKGHLNYFRIGLGQSVAQLTGHSARPSGVDGGIEGLIVVNLNGEGRGVPSRATKPKEKYETSRSS